MKKFIYLILVLMMVFTNSINVLALDDPIDPLGSIDVDDVEAQYEAQVITRPEFRICYMKYKQCLKKAEDINDMLICKALYGECLERHEGDKSE